MLRLYKSDAEICLGALEGRAAAFERLKDYERAGSDARAMVRLAPQGFKVASAWPRPCLMAKGYLRLGKVLRLQKRLEDALKVYELGIKRARLTAEIERQVEATRAQMAKTGGARRRLAVDIFTALPSELIRKILRLLPWSSRLQVLQMSQASLRFRHRCRDWRCRLVLHGDTVKSSQLHRALTSRSAVERVVRELVCFPPQQSWSIVVRLGERGLLRFVQTLRLFHLNIDGETLLGVVAQMPRLRSLYCKKCVFTRLAPALGTILALDGTRGRRTISFSQCHLADEVLSSATLTSLARLAEHDSWRTLLLDFAPPFDGPIYLGRGASGPWIREQRDSPVLLGRRLRRGSFVSQEQPGGSMSAMDWVGILVQSNANGWPWMQEMLSRPRTLHLLHILTLSTEQETLFECLSLHGHSLKEIGIHSYGAGRGNVVEPRRFIGGLLAACPHLRLICLPFLSVLSLDRQRSLASLVPATCRIIFDPSLSIRIAYRFCRLTPWGLVSPRI